MRLIDADSLIEQMDAEPEGGYYSPHDVISLLMTQPTIEERKTGEWIDFSMSIKGVPTEACGECGEWSYGMGKKFCPNCGADMKGEQP